MRTSLMVCVVGMMLLGTVGCATYSVVPSCGIVPHRYSDTECGHTVCNDKMVPSADADLLAPDRARMVDMSHRPFMRPTGYDEGMNGYTTRAPRDFFLQNPPPLGY